MRDDGVTHFCLVLLLFVIVLTLNVYGQTYPYPDNAKECIAQDGVPLISNGVVLACYWPQNNSEGFSKDCVDTKSKRYGRVIMCGQVYDDKDIVELPPVKHLSKAPPPCRFESPRDGNCV
jgi:hypothetical protein